MNAHGSSDFSRYLTTCTLATALFALPSTVRAQATPSLVDPNLLVGQSSVDLRGESEGRQWTAEQDEQRERSAHGKSSDKRILARLPRDLSLPFEGVMMLAKSRFPSTSSGRAFAPLRMTSVNSE